jgi:hypothetical protein
MTHDEALELLMDLGLTDLIARVIAGPDTFPLQIVETTRKCQLAVARITSIQDAPVLNDVLVIEDVHYVVKRRLVRYKVEDGLTPAEIDSIGIEVRPL